MTILVNEICVPLRTYFICIVYQIHWGNLAVKKGLQPSQAETKVNTN